MNFIPARSERLGATHQRAQGRLDIALAVSAGRTRLARFYQQGCLKARLPRVPGAPEIVALNISGGIAGGDALETSLELGPAAQGVFTTQAAERLYRAIDAPARIATRLLVGEGARLAYLPQETILFDGFSLDRRLEIDLSPGAEILGVESLVFGRLAMGEVLTQGRLRDRISLRRGQRLVWQDMTRLEGDIFGRLDRPGIANGARAVASLFAAGADVEAKLPALRAALEGVTAGASLRDGVLLARILAADAAALRRAVIAALDVFGRGALPRVWQG